MYSIGEFSKITGLTVKTLRFYHEQEILKPSHVDPQSGYRYYDASKIETARIIAELRKLDFPLTEIAEILLGYDDEADILDYLSRHRQTVREKMQSYQEIGKVLDRIITKEHEAQTTMKSKNFDIEEKTIETMLIAGIRMQGKHSDCGQGFSQIGRRLGRHVNGKPFLLHYDSEYKEDDADFEACMPVRKGNSKDGISVRELPGGHCVALLHQGPYDTLGSSYARLLDYIKEKEYDYELPTREVYIKGPGIIFKGNPKKYLTEIQFFIQ